MKKVKMNSLELLDSIKFRKMALDRKLFAAKGSSKSLNVNYNTNEVSKLLHPGNQKVLVKEIINESKEYKTLVLVSSNKDETLATFKSGQWVNVTVNVEESVVTRPYFISSSPKMARNGEYRITVKNYTKGVVSNYLFNTLKVGDSLEISEPCGDFVYSGIRDQKRIIGIAYDSGISAFYSLAQSILEGEEDVELVLYYGAKKEKNLIFKEKFDDIVCKTNKVKVYYVLSDEDNEQYLNGMVDLRMVKEELYSAVSFFIAVPKDTLDYLNKEFKSLKLPRKYFRYQVVSPMEKEKKYKLYKLTVVTRKEILIIPCQSNESLMTAMEKEGIKITDSVCRSKLVYGKVKILDDNRKKADAKYNYIIPRDTFPEDNCKIELPI